MHDIFTPDGPGVCGDGVRSPARSSPWQRSSLLSSLSDLGGGLAVDTRSPAGAPGACGVHQRGHSSAVGVILSSLLTPREECGGHGADIRSSDQEKSTLQTVWGILEMKEQQRTLANAAHHPFLGVLSFSARLFAAGVIALLPLVNPAALLNLGVGVRPGVIPSLASSSTLPLPPFLLA